MALFGVWVLGVTAWHLVNNSMPVAETMGVVGALALAANTACFMLLWQFRAGDSNMRSVWICTRNDMLGNIAVLLAAVGVFGTGAGWPDAVVATIMALLALQGSWTTVRLARAELHTDHGHAHHAH